MTTIAWDGLTLAADGQTTGNDSIETMTFKKVRRISVSVRDEKTIAYALAGDMSAFFDVENWISNGCDSNEFPSKFECCGFLVTANNVYSFDSQTAGLYEIENVSALGSGANFCRSAMELGLSAKDAVKHACKLDVFSGGKITAINCR